MSRGRNADHRWLEDQEFTVAASRLWPGDVHLAQDRSANPQPRYFANLRMRARFEGFSARSMASDHAAAQAALRKLSPEERAALQRLLRGVL